MDNIKEKRALIVVDAQYDFMPATKENYEKGLGGALAVTDGDQIIPVINELLPKFDLIIFTKDWHPEGMDCFASSHKEAQPFETFTNAQGNEDVLWPDHCIRNTFGSEIHKDINFDLIKGNFYIFKKGLEKDFHPYSGFGAEGLEEFLKERGIEQLFMVGLATDYCVKDTAIDSANLGFETVVVMDGTRGISDDLGPTLKEFGENGVLIMNSLDLLDIL